MTKGNLVEVRERGPLTPREADALLWTAEGKSAWEAGVILGTSKRTIEAHIASASRKLGASNKPNLVALGFLTGILNHVSMPVIAGLICLGLSLNIGPNTVRRPRRTRHEYEVATITNEVSAA